MMKGTRTPPRFIRPMEWPKVDQLAEGELCEYELKLDGCIAIKEEDDAQLFSRNGNLFQCKIPIATGRCSKAAWDRRKRIEREFADLRDPLQ
jgi:hypothetical protein